MTRVSARHVTAPRVTPLIERARARLLMVACIALGTVIASAHVGTNQVLLEGRAGGYPIRVMIDPPGIVPAQVSMLVRVLDGTPTAITIRAAQWNVGTKGAPPAENMSPVPGDAGLWAHDLWIMTSSTYAVYVAVDGPLGAGTMVVPMQTSATQTLGMKRGMGALLIVLGALLFVGILSIVSASAREGSLPLGENPSMDSVKRARTAAAVAAGVVTLALIGGAKWWNVAEADYRRRLYKPIAIHASVAATDGDRLLTIAMRDGAWRKGWLAPLMPDHGKLMHLFLIGADNETAIAHLHPLRVHPDSFVTRIPPVPGGRYLLFGDVLFQNGTQRTLVDTIDVPVAAVIADNAGRAVQPAAAVRAFIDRDDAWRVVAPVAMGETATLASGGSVQLTTDRAVVAKRDVRMMATVRDANGSASTIEPYLGMSGHAMVLRRDAGIFMHVHPYGSASMTAQSQLIKREAGDTARLDSAAIAALLRDSSATSSHDMSAMPSDAPSAAGVVNFPFSFPTAGAYRVFVQIKRHGAVETTAFDVTVGLTDGDARSSVAAVSPTRH